MDVSAIATTTISLLTPYLAMVGQATAKKAGEAAWQKTAEIHRAIKARFQKEEDASYAKTIDRFEKAPEENAAATLIKLENTLAKDKDFTRYLVTLLKEADDAGAGAVFNVNNFGGEVGKIININQADNITIY